MCGSTLFGFLLGFVLVKAVRGYRRWRWGGRGDCGGGCGGRFGQGGGYGRRWGDDSDYYGGGPKSYGRWAAPGSVGGDGGRGSRSSGRPLDELLRSLELNERQQSESVPLFALIKERFGTTGPRVDLALRILATEPFDPTPLLPQLGDLPEPAKQALIEGLEHVHTILISEQRDALRRKLDVNSPPPSTTSL